jgi:TonB family protein
LSGVVPAASAPAPGSSPAQWPSQSPTDAATLDSSGGHPVVVEPRSSNSDGSSPAAAPAAEPRTQPEGGGREIIPVPQAAGNAAGRAVSSHPSSVASRGSLPEASLAAPISTGSAAARVSADPPPNVSGADAGRARANNLGGIVGSAPVNVPAPARAVPAAPITVGGRVQEPRLISSVPPIYPQTAIQANVQGDVKIQATIDETGRVTKMRVISGPPLLQRAAMDALRQWRYEPSRLDDQPVAVDMAVTVRFRR